MKKILLFISAAAVCAAALPAAACHGKEDGGSKYVIEATYDKQTRSLNGKVNFTYYNTTDNAIEELKFNLWGNAYREGAKYRPVAEAYSSKAYYAGASYGGESIEKVDGCDSWEVTGEDENILTVTLTQPVYPEESVTLDITYALNLAQVNHRTGVTQSTVNLGNFYPVLCAYSEEGFIETPYYSCGDPFVSECADYEVSLTIPKEYIAAASGKELSRTVAGDNATIRYELKSARDFAAVLSPSFKSVTKSAGGCDVTLYYTCDEQPEKRLEAACESMEYFTQTFGAYPYPTLSVVLTPLTVSGMEYPALTMIADGQEMPDSVYTVVHENAHQWWYAAVGSDQVNCAWQDEGLAEYSALCFFETHPEYGFTRTALLGNAIKSYRAYYSVYNQIFSKADTTMSRSLKDFTGDYEYVNVTYNKSLLAFESVRTAMGDKKFFSALKSYYENNLFALAPQEELIARFAALHDVEGIFNSFIQGKVVI